MDAGTAVTLVVAAANNTVRVPPLVGTTQDYAVSLLNSMNLVPKIVTVDSTLPGGTVDHQSPEASTEVEPGSTVTIYVSNAPEVTTVKVPPVAGLGFTEAQAEAQLAAARARSEGRLLWRRPTTSRALHLPEPGGGQDGARSAAWCRSP